MATEGKLEEFNLTAWTSWSDCFGFYCEANEIAEPSKKRALLLTLCGAQTYEVVRALVAPRTPGSVPFDELMAMLQKHFDPRPSELFSRTKFQRRDQQPGESIATYAAALKKLAADCNFGILATQTAAPSPGTTGVASAATGTTAGPASADAPGTAITVSPPVPNPTMLPLDVMLRDRFVCGIMDEHLQQRLFAETNLTFKKAYDMAVRTEGAAQH